MKLLLYAFLIWPAFAQYAMQYQGQQPSYVSQQQEYPQQQNQQLPQFSQYRTSPMNDAYGSNGVYAQQPYNSPYGRNNYNNNNGFSSTPYNQYGYSSPYDPNRPYSSAYDANRQFDTSVWYNGVSPTSTVAALATTALAFIL